MHSSILKPGSVAAAFLILAFCFSSCDKQVKQSNATVFTVASDATNPTVAIDDNSEQVYLAWVGNSNESKTVFVSGKSRGDSHFSEPVQINDVAGNATAQSEAPAKIAVGPEGNVYVLWHYNIPIEGRRFPGSNIRFSRSTDSGKSFASAIFVNDDYEQTPTGHGFHDMIVGGTGIVYVSWLDGRNQNNSPQVRVARSTDGGQTFEASVVVDNKVCTCCKTAMATDSEGRLYVIYRDATPENIRDITIARSDDNGKTFTEPVLIHNDDWLIQGCPHNGPDISIDSEDNVHVVWYNGREDTYGVYYSVSSDKGATFQTPLHLNTNFEGSPLRASISAKDLTSAYIACEVGSYDGSEVYLLGPNFSGSERLQKKSMGSGNYPAMAMNKNFVAVAWLEGKSIQASIEEF